MKVIHNSQFDLSRIKQPPKGIYLPDGFDAVKLLEEYTLKLNEEKSPKPWKVMLLMHCLYSRIEKDPESKIYNHAPVSSKKMQQYVPNYSEYLKYFKEIGIIIDETNHSGGRFTKAYKLADKYLKAYSKFHPAHDEALSKALKKTIDKKMPTSFIENHQYLFKGFDEKLKIDHKKALNLAKGKCFRSGVIQLPLYKREEAAIKKVESPVNGFTLDANGRLYTPISNLRSELRKFITYNGERLKALDQKNAQPYLLNFLWTDNEAIRGLKDELISRQHNKSKNPIPRAGFKQTSIMLSERYNVDESQAQQYFQLTSEGKIYEHLNEYLLENSPYKAEYPHNMRMYEQTMHGNFTLHQIVGESLEQYSDQWYRKSAKKLFAQHFYSDKKSSIVREYFQAYFPSILEVLDIAKEEDYRYLSHILTQIESYIVLHQITADFSHENPSARVFTIHDSIATQERFIEALQAKTEEVFTRYLTKPPQLHDEPWCEGCILEMYETY